MKLFASKRMVVPGEAILTCQAWHGSEGSWVGKVQSKSSKLVLYKLEPKWKFFLPHEQTKDFNEVMTAYCTENPTLADKPYCVFFNDYCYEVRMEL